MAQTIKIRRSTATAVVGGVTSLAFGVLTVTNISGVTRYYVGDSANLAKEIAGDAYAKLASPAFTGVPTAPTAAPLDNSTQIATTAYVDAAVSVSATDLGTGTVDGTSYEVTSSTGTSVVLPSANTTEAGLLSAAYYNTLTEMLNKGKITVDNQATRFALTTADVILDGSPVNIVYQIDTKQVYLIVDTAKLDNAAGYLLIASNINDSISTATNVYSAAKVDSQISAAVTGLFEYKGAIDCSANPNYPAASVGDVYKVTVAGKIGGASGLVVEIGDTIYCSTNSAGGTQAAVGSSYDVIQVNIDVNALAGAGLVVNAGALDVNTDNSSIEISADALRVKALGITNAMLAGSIADSKLNTITTANKVSGSAIQLGTTSGLADSTGLIVVADATGGSNLSRSINISANGVAIKIDGVSIIEGASNRLEIATIDGGTF
jgi:hypothetical protein